MKAGVTLSNLGSVCGVFVEERNVCVIAVELRLLAAICKDVLLTLGCCRYGCVYLHRSSGHHCEAGSYWRCVLGVIHPPVPIDCGLPQPWPGSWIACCWLILSYVLLGSLRTYAGSSSDSCGGLIWFIHDNRTSPYRSMGITAVETPRLRLLSRVPSQNHRRSFHKAQRLCRYSKQVSLMISVQQRYYLVT